MMLTVDWLLCLDWTRRLHIITSETVTCANAHVVVSHPAIE